VNFIHTHTMKVLWLAIFFHLTHLLAAQSFEISGFQDSYKGKIGEIIKAPLRLKNVSDKPITLIIRKVEALIGGTQKNYFCLAENCLDANVEDHTVRIEPQQTYTVLQIALEGGLAPGVSSVKYAVFNRSNPADTFEFEVNFQVEEQSDADIYNSDVVVLHDVYPNPVSDYAFVDYKILDERVKASIIIHNLLGNPIDEYQLPFGENKVKLRADALSAGIYFYTLYLDNEGVITRKLIVRK
jgi:hypothetical protein